VLPNAFVYGLCQIHGFKCAPNVLKKQPCFFNSLNDIITSFSLSATSIHFRAGVRLIKKFGSIKTKSGTVQRFRCLNTACGKTFNEQRFSGRAQMLRRRLAVTHRHGEISMPIPRADY
jgi:hypothetical protein